MAATDSIDIDSGENLSALEYLARADKEMVAGNGREAAGLLWKATRATLVGLARDKGLDRPENDEDALIELARDMEKHGSISDYYYRGKIAAGSLLREHADSDVLEGYELESSYRVAREFVVKCNTAGTGPPICISTRTEDT